MGTGGGDILEGTAPSEVTERKTRVKRITLPSVARDFSRIALSRGTACSLSMEKLGDFSRMINGLDAPCLKD